ncbi:hypothetical protein [Bacillus sp. FJAT-47783]|uniref:hypothetical protein n=1 Tax=Bacillus sp. FJAT-47783 TaxID=2922712 RepID=UPI001FAB5DF6|nr:hypothetical protein [Bacillus sp. FJAT-47783]
MEEVLSILSFIVALIFFTCNHESELKQLKIWQKLGCLLLLFLYIGICVFVFHFIGGMINRYLSIEWLSYIFKIVLVFVTISVASIGFHKSVHKLTNGVLFPEN